MGKSRAPLAPVLFLLAVVAMSCSHDITSPLSSKSASIKAPAAHANSLLGTGDYVCAISVSLDVNPVDVGDTTHVSGSGNICDSTNTVIYTGDLDSYGVYNDGVTLAELPGATINHASFGANAFDVVGVAVGSIYVAIGVCGADAGLSGDSCRIGQVTLNVVNGLSAVIEGTTMLPEGSSATYTASVGGGYPPYTYSWGGPMSGSASSATGTISSSDYITLNVSDAHGHHVLANLYVTACPSPEFSC